jgi:hypothetical protein
VRVFERVFADAPPEIVRVLERLERELLELGE